MSRIGNRVLAIPSGVTAVLGTDNWVEVEGPLGKRRRQFDKRLRINVGSNQITIQRDHDGKLIKQLHGTTNALLHSMLIGVKTGFSRRLVISGVGYRAQLQDDTLKLSLGFSQPISYVVPAGITIQVLKAGLLEIRGTDKQQVGHVAACIRGLRPVEPYKGKGISYQTERVRRKAGKTAGK